MIKVFCAVGRAQEPGLDRARVEVHAPFLGCDLQRAVSGEAHACCVKSANEYRDLSQTQLVIGARAVG